MTSDRIMRCNPAAYHYHIKSDLEFDDNGYLLDPVHPIHIDPVNGNKSPLTAAVLSAMIPGLGRIYNGRIYEGFLSGLFTSLMGYRALESYQYDSSVRSTVLTLTAVILYTGEIYGAYRTTKYYPSRIHP